MIIRDLLTLLELPTLPKDEALPPDDQPASAAGPVKALEDEEFRGWLEEETAKLPPRHVNALRGYFDGTVRKADVVALGMSRTFFDKLLKSLAEKWLRVSG